MKDHSSSFPKHLSGRYNVRENLDCEVYCISKRVNYYSTYLRKTKEEKGEWLWDLEELEEDIGVGAATFIEGIITLSENLLVRIFEYCFVNEEKLLTRVRQEIEKDFANMCTIVNHTYTFKANRKK